MVTTPGRRGLRAFWFCLFALAICPPTFAQEATLVFIAPSTALRANGQSSLWLYCMNNSSNELSPTFDSQLNAKFITPSGTRNAILTLNPASLTNTTIAPGAFAKEEYFLTVPAAIHGSVSLDISNYNQVSLRIEAPMVAAQPEIKMPPPTPINPPTSLAIRSDRFKLGKFFDNHLSPYEPIYFLLGTAPAAEFQLSLKFQIFDVTNHYSFLTNLYFGYTQKSYWDLISSDPSFFDTSYKPSIFVYLPGVVGPSNSLFRLDLQGGAEHESNGRGGAMERSIYTAYLQPTLTFGRPGKLQLALQPRARTYFLVGPNNPDIANYRGYVDLRAFLTLKSDPDSWANFQVETKFTIGAGGSHPGLEINGRYKIPGFNPTLQVQYFEGYGQTLRQYNQDSHGFRVGLCLWYWPEYPTVQAAK